jgi:hypothetical protein
MANKKRKVNTLSCACNWPECQSFSSLFNRYEDRDYAGNHIELRCGIESLGSERAKSKQRAIMDTIFVNLNKEIDSSCVTKGKILIARHHYSRKALMFFKNQRVLYGTPLPLKAARMATAIVDYRFKFEWQGQETKYFICPNNPKATVQDEINKYNMTIPDSSQLKTPCKTSSTARQVRNKNRILGNRLEEKVQSSRALRQQRRDMQKDELTTVAKKLEMTTKESQTRKMKLVEVAKFKSMTWREMRSYSDQMKIENDAKTVSLQNQIKDMSNVLEEKSKQEIEYIQHINQWKEKCRQASRKRKSSLPKSIEVIDGLQGMSRQNLISETFHISNPSLTKTWFGFDSFVEMKTYIEAYFYINSTQVKTIIDLESGIISCMGEDGRTLLSEFEQIILTKLYLHSVPNRTKVAHIYGIDRM